MSIIGNRYRCQCCNRIAVITDEYYEDHYDCGYVYEFEGEPGKRWISTAAAAQRFTLYETAERRARYANG